MAVLITGHKGFIGQNMMAALPGSVGYEWGDGPLSLTGIDRVIHLGAISSTACTDEAQRAETECGLQHRPAGPLRPAAHTHTVCIVGVCVRARGYDLSGDRHPPIRKACMPNQSTSWSSASPRATGPCRCRRFATSTSTVRTRITRTSPLRTPVPAQAAATGGRSVRGQRCDIQGLCAGGEGNRGPQTVI